jgi:arylformamidase
MPILDLTPPLSRRTACWPGDGGFSLAQTDWTSPEVQVKVGRMETTLHAGAHADAPSHYLPGAPSIDRVDLEPYLGPCEVIEVTGLAPGARILPEHLPGPVRAPRVLFRTLSFPDREVFTEGFTALSPELVRHLHAQGVLLVGIDTPSVDPFASRALESHQALGACGLRVLENLELAHVAPGLYTLSALPLRIEDGDGSPVRAVLFGASAP